MHSRAGLFRASALPLLAVLVALTSCQRDTAEPSGAAPPAKVEMPEPLEIPAPPPPVLDRAGLLAAMEQAASAYAAGEPQSDGALADRRFSVRQSFGCSGEAPEHEVPGVAGWSWQSERKAIQLRLPVDDWTDSSLVEGRSDVWEAVEGIWLERPWLPNGDCPRIITEPEATAEPPAPQTMGLAAVFETGGSRIRQRSGRAYSFTVRGKASAPPAAPDQGYRLVLEGRLSAFADGGTINCHARAPDRRPVCVAAARLDRVAFEDATGVVLTEWRSG